MDAERNAPVAVVRFSRPEGPVHCAPHPCTLRTTNSIHLTADDRTIPLIVISGLYRPTLCKRCTFAIDRGMSIFIMEKTFLAAPDSPFVRPAPRARPTHGAGHR